jgi:hypothetical protein
LTATIEALSGAHLALNVTVNRDRRYGHRMILLRTRALALAGALLALSLLAACGGSSGGGKTTAKASSSPASTESATALITANWQAFFDVNTPQSKPATLLEDGASMGAALTAAVKEQQQTHIKQGAKVLKVTLTDATHAQVTYQLLDGTKVLLDNASGVAVLQDGVWKVSKATFCTLVLLGNNNQPVAGC